MARRQTQITIKFGLALLGAVALSGVAFAAGPAQDTGHATTNNSTTSTVNETTTGGSNPNIVVTTNDSGDSSGTIGTAGSQTPNTGAGLDVTDHSTGATLGDPSNSDPTATATIDGGSVAPPPASGDTPTTTNGTVAALTTTGAAATTATNTPLRSYHYVVPSHQTPAAPAPQVSATTSAPPPANHPAPTLPAGAAVFRDTAIVVPSVEHNHFDLGRTPAALRSLGLATGLALLTIMASYVLASLFLMHQRRTGFSLAPRGPGALVLQSVTQHGEFAVRSNLTTSSLFSGSMLAARTVAARYRLGLKTNFNLTMLQRKGVTT